MAYFRKVPYLILIAVLVMVVFNLSSFNLPTDKSRYDQSLSYFNETETRYGLAAYDTNDIGSGMTSFRNEVILLKDSQPAFDLLIAAMEKAQKNINIGIYVIHNDETGNKFKNVLINKAQQGVAVRLLYDAWGAGLTPPSFFNDLRSNGIKVAAYNPLWSGFLQGRLPNRLHRKMIIIDGKQAFIGGVNIGDEYLGRNEEIGYWKDTGLIINGDAALSIQQAFLNDWLQASHEKVMDKDLYPRTDVTASQRVEIILGDPDSPFTDMGSAHVKLITKAQESIFMITPYFFPDAAVLDALYSARARNIDVHLILPHQSDSKLANITNYFYTKKLLQHDIKVSTYNRGFIHSKVIIIDHHMASVGSANLEKLSHSKNQEIIAVIYDKELIRQLEGDFSNNLEDSTTILQ